MENIQSQMNELFGNSCYAYCLAYLNGNRTLKDLTKAVLEYWYKGYVEDDGFVTQPQKIMNCKDVQKVPVKTIADIKEPTIVCYEYNGGTHFIIAQNGKVLFDASGDSNSVKFGKPVSIRRFV